MVTYSLENKLAPTDLTSELLTQIAQDKLGIHVELSDDLLRRALDPQAFVEARTVFGGSAPSATGAVLDLQAVTQHYCNVIRYAMMSKISSSL